MASINMVKSLLLLANLKADMDQTEKDSKKAKGSKKETSADENEESAEENNG